MAADLMRDVTRPYVICLDISKFPTFFVTASKMLLNHWWYQPALTTIFAELAAACGIKPSSAAVLRLAARIGQALAEVMPDVTLAEADERSEALAQPVA